MQCDPPGAWAGSLDVHQIRESLPVSLRDRPLDFFAGQSKDLFMAQTCLEFILAKTVAKHPKEKLRQLYSRAQIGTHGLAWLHRNYDHVDLSSVAGIGFIKALIHIALPQIDSERHIWILLKNPRTPKVLCAQPYRERTAWRGLALRFLVESQAYWGDGTEGFDQALRSLSHAWSIEDNAIRKDRHLIPKAPAAVWTFKELVYRGASSSADEKLYNDFIDQVPRWRVDPLEIEYVVVRLLRTHPSRPRPLPSFEFLQHCIALRPRPEFVRQILLNWTGYTFICDSARALDRAGHHAEARRMLDIGYDEMPEYFSMVVRRNENKTCAQAVPTPRSSASQQFMSSERSQERRVYITPWQKRRQ
jgi:hypothetical protein